MSDRKQLSLPRDSPDRKNGETRCRTWGRPEMTVLGSLGLMEKAAYLRQPTAMEVPPRVPLLSLWTLIPQPSLLPTSELDSAGFPVSCWPGPSAGLKTQEISNLCG